MYIHSKVISTECSDSQNFVFNWGGGIESFIELFSVFNAFFFCKNERSSTHLGKVMRIVDIGLFRRYR